MWFCADDCGSVANNVVTFADNPVSSTLIVANNLVEKWPMIAVGATDDCSSQQLCVELGDDVMKAATYRGG